MKINDKKKFFLCAKAVKLLRAEKDSSANGLPAPPNSDESYGLTRKELFSSLEPVPQWTWEVLNRLVESGYLESSNIVHNGTRQIFYKKTKLLDEQEEPNLENDKGFLHEAIWPHEFPKEEVEQGPQEEDPASATTDLDAVRECVREELRKFCVPILQEMEKEVKQLAALTDVQTRQWLGITKVNFDMDKLNLVARANEHLLKARDVLDKIIADPASSEDWRKWATPHRDEINKVLKEGLE